MDNQRPEQREPLRGASINWRSGAATVVAAALGAVAGAMTAAKLPSDKFAWTGFAMLPLFLLLEVFLTRLVSLFDGDRNAARFTLAGALVAGFYGAWFGARFL
jgi:uncharacterized membrane protein YfcA